ncbi:MAG: hypothetical protein RBU29_01950, partial [bacterium]|nr:hypothetical protein [bacterium]
PGALFNFTPIATILRGEHAGDQLSPTGSHMRFHAEGDGVVLFGQDDPIPDPKGKTALIDRDTGLIYVGDEPGRTTITATYDDGYTKKAVSLDAIFSRVEMAVSTQGQITGSTQEILITEYIYIQVQITNPNSSFLGDVPLCITLLGEDNQPEPFYAAYHRNRHTGNGVVQVPGNNFYPFQFAEVTEFDLTTDSTERPDAFTVAPGVFELYISPRRTGEHRFQFEVRDDPGVEPQVISLRVIKPKMVLQHPLPVRSNTTNFIPDDAPVVVNSWVNIYHRAPESAISPFDLVEQAQGNTFSRFAHNDVVYWTITDPIGQEQTIPVTDLFNSTTSFQGGTFSKVFDIPGIWYVKHGLKSRPEIETEKLPVHVVLPQDVEDVSDSALAEVMDEDSSQAVPRAQQFGAFEILSPLGGGWAPGVPIPVTVQCYNALGQPGPIGKTIITRYYSNTNEGLKLVDERTGQQVIGLNADFMRNPDFYIDGNLAPDSGGKIQFSILPTERAQNNLGRDLIVLLSPLRFATHYDETRFITGLPVERRQYIDGDGGVTEAAPIGITSFLEEKFKTYNRQTLFVSGRGLASTPRQIPLVSPRVQQAVAEGKIPEASRYASMILHGNARFGQAIPTGITALQFQDELGKRNLQIQHSQARGTNQLAVTFNPITLSPGNQYLTAVMGDQSEWEVVMEFFRCRIADPQMVNHSDKNLPLNGRHHNAHEVGSQQFDVVNESYPVVLHQLQLELIPSIQAGDSFRGAIAPSPLVGFDMERDEKTGLRKVFGLKQNFFQRNFSAFMVFGNNGDRLSLNPEGTNLIADSGPDGLPDFVSAAPNAEKLLVSLDGNLADYYEFTAYNLIASVTQDFKDPELGFDQLKDSSSQAYSKYGNPSPKKTVGQVDRELAQQGISVYVDREAPNPPGGPTFFKGVPSSFFGGILDQYYLSRTIYRTNFRPTTAPIGKDGRVRAFDGERSQGLNVTQRDRRGFGIELDALLFEPMLDGAFDLDPNSPELVSLPIVHKANPQSRVLTAKGLLPQEGGTSGGYFDLDRQYPGSHQVVAKTPGLAFPGLHAGYLIQDTSAILTDPYLGTEEAPSIENDIEEVLILRDGEAADVAGSKIHEEQAFFKLFGQLNQMRRVHAFGTARDKKQPITTSLLSNFKYQITTDPPGLEESIPAIASLWLKEIPRAADEQINLLATTQSYGNEFLQKAAVDFVIDMSVNIASQITLAALTGGVGNLECGGLDVADALSTATLNFALATSESELFENQVDADTAGVFRLANSVLRDGQSFIPYVDSVQATVSDFTGDLYPELKDLKDIPGHLREVAGSWAKAPGKVGKVGICSVINAPFEMLKSSLKASFSVEGLGGLGAAEAIGERYLCVSIPQSAWREGPGALYSAQYSLRRVVDIIPDEPYLKYVEEEDYPAEYKTDAAVEDDLDWIARILADLDNPAKKDAAQNLLRDINRTAVSRASAQYDHLYREHKIRYGRLPSFEVIMTPKGELDETGKRVGDFMLQTDETAINVATASMVMASRTNENAGARAILTSNGYDLRLLNITIPDPFQAHQPAAKTSRPAVLEAEKEGGHTQWEE